MTVESTADLVSSGAHGPKETRRITRNIVLLSFAFMLHFTAFQGVGNLQSSINDDEGVGTASMATIYAALVFSNLFIPVVLIKYLGCKWTVALSFICYMPYIGAQFYPKFSTMIPAGILVGLGGAPLWVGKCTYLSVAAEAYKDVSGVPTDVLTVRFFGIFFMIFQFSQVWGNLISSTVFSTESHAVTNMTGDMGDICGANFLPGEDAGSAAIPPSREKVYIVAGIYLACMVLACVTVGLTVDSLKRYNEAARQGATTTGVKLLVVTVKLLKESRQLLLIPLTMFLGIEQAFVFADYTASFVSCAWGVQNIGYVMIGYGVFNSISAICAGWLVKVTGRMPIIGSAGVLHAAVLITLLLWRPHAEDRVLYFVMSGLWGVCDGVWLAQINALCGIMFPGREEAAYSNFRIWESIGYIMSYSYSHYVITWVKITILLVFLAVGMVGYFIVEVLTKRINSSKKEKQ